MRPRRFFWTIFVVHLAVLAAATLGIAFVAGAFVPSATTENASSLQVLLWPWGVVVAAATLVATLGWVVAWGRYHRRMAKFAHQMALSDLESDLRDVGDETIDSLARAVNLIRRRMSRQLGAVDRQRRSLALLLTHLQEGVLVARQDGRLVLLNPAAARLLHIADELVLAVGAGKFPVVEECVPQRELQLMLLQKAEHPLTPAGDEQRLTILHPQGDRSLLARASKIALPDGNGDDSPAGQADAQSGRLLVLTDITELTKAIKVRSDFVTNASHELRTPLSTIRSAVETLCKMDRTKDPQTVGQFLEMISRQIRRLEAMVTDLLELSSLESTARPYSVATLHLQRVCDELHERWSERLAAKELHWAADVGPQCGTMRANAHLLRIILDNLVENAIKFTPPRGHVSVHCHCESNGVAIAVRDDGCGIPPHEQSRVFERFYQVSASRASTIGVDDRGTGLGLSIVRHAATALGGEVRLESQLDRGTCVTLLLPRSKPGTADAH